MKKNKKKCWKPLELEKNVHLFKHKLGTIAYKYFEKKKDQKKTILLFYGFCGNIQMAEFFCQFLINKGYNILTFDYPGHGYSPKNDIEPEELIIITRDLITFLKEKKIYIIGYSFGGVKSLLFYKENKKNIKKIVLWNTKDFFADNFFNKILYKIFELFLKFNFKFAVNYFAIPLLKDKFITRELLKTARSITLYNDPFSVINNFKKVICLDISNILSSITCEALFISSKIDILAKLSYMKKMALKINTSRLIILKDAGHLSFVSKAKIVAEEVIDFFNNSYKNE